MKRVVIMIFAMTIAFAFNANIWAQEAEICLDCPYEKNVEPNDLDEICAPTQSTCYPVADEVRLIIDPCVCSGGCVGGDFWIDGDFVGVSVESITPGLYLYEGNVSIKLFKKFDAVSSSNDPNDVCDYVDGDSIPSPYPHGSNDSAWDFRWSETDSASTTRDRYGLLEYFHDKNDNNIDPNWCGTVPSCYEDCELTDDNQRITYATTCGIDDNAWILDIDDSADTDDDGEIGEDAGNHYVLIETMQTITNWSEIEENELRGTTGQLQVCILSMKNAVSGLCTECDIKCCCPVDAVEWCDESVGEDYCIYFPYLESQNATCGSAIIITNLDPETTEPADMHLTAVVVDSDGVMHTGTLDDFGGKAVSAWTVDGFLDACGITPAAGPIALKLFANFVIDGAHGMLCDYGGGTSFGAMTLARQNCCAKTYYCWDWSKKS